MRIKARPGSLDCKQACDSDVRCQSYNYVMFQDICELNTRMKEARPDDLIKSSDRYYVTKAPYRGREIQTEIHLFLKPIKTTVHVTNMEDAEN